MPASPGIEVAARVALGDDRLAAPRGCRPPRATARDRRRAAAGCGRTIAVSTTMNGANRRRKKRNGRAIRRATPSACWIDVELRHELAGDDVRAGDHQVGDGTAITTARPCESASPRTSSNSVRRAPARRGRRSRSTSASRRPARPRCSRRCRRSARATSSTFLAPVVLQRLEPRAARADQRVLSRDEERVERDEDRRGGEEERRHRRSLLRGGRRSRATRDEGYGGVGHGERA